MSYCSTCGKYMLFPDSHKCLPAWEAQDPHTRDDDDWTTVYACDEESAAAEYAEKADSRSGDGPQERTVLVRLPGSSDAKRFSINWEYSVDYYAHEEKGT